jgi:hypothetical protein
MFRVRVSFLFALQLLPGQEREVLEVHGKDFHAMYYIIAWIQIFSIPVFLAGQTTCIFAYDWTVKNGLQESGAEVGPSLVQVNRAYGVSDTILYIPLLASSAYGLFRKKRWSLICTAASGGIHSYWSLTTAFCFVFLPNVEEYAYKPGLGIWMFVLFYMIYGILVLTFLYRYWGVLFSVMGN